MTLILSFLQQYFAKLSERTVAYINVDIAVFGKMFHLHCPSGEMKIYFLANSQFTTSCCKLGLLLIFFLILIAFETPNYCRNVLKKLPIRVVKVKSTARGVQGDQLQTMVTMFDYNTKEDHFVYHCFNMM